MACFFTDNVHTKSFTPREYQVELLDAAKERNIIICLASECSKTFISLKLIQELSSCIRQKWKKGKKLTLYLGDLNSVRHHTRVLRHLTDLSIGEYYVHTENPNLEKDQVVVTTSDVCYEWLVSSKLKWNNINLLIIEDCHSAIRHHSIRKIVLGLKAYKGEKPRILGLTSPLFTGSSVEPGCVEAAIKHLEADLSCTAESASDIVSILKYSARPREILVECGDPAPCELTMLLSEEVANVQSFLNDHRYDPTEIYQDEFLDEIRDIPDPKMDPFSILEDFLGVLNSMGPWCADKAALLLLIHIEKLKVKTPYERHFLLLCLVSSVLLKIRAICDNTFQELCEIDKINKYSSPKVLRLIEIVRHFKPKKIVETTVNNAVNGMESISYEKDGKPINENEPLNSAFNDLESHNHVNEGINHSSPDGFINCLDNNYLDQELNNGPTSIINSSNFDDNNFSSHPSYISHRYEDLIKRFNTFGKGLVSTKNRSHYKTIPPNSIYNSNEDINSETSNCVCQSNDSELSDSKEFGFKVEKIPEQIENEKNCIKSKTENMKILNGDDDCHQKGKPCIEDSDVSDSTSNNYNVSDDYKNLTDNKCTDSVTHDFSNSPEKLTISNSKAAGLTFEESYRGGYRNRGRGRGWRQQRKGAPGTGPRTYKHYTVDDIDNLCGIIFVQDRFTAKVLFHLLNDLRKHDPDFANISTQYTVGKIADPTTDTREAELEHKKQEDVLKRFRMRDCNLVVATSVLEEGIELPRCNLVVRYDPVSHFKSHANSKARARQQYAYYIVMMEQASAKKYLETYARFMLTEKMLLGRCANDEPSVEEENEADLYTDCIPIYKPLPTEGEPSVNISTAVALVNRYCAKLPSDTFTRLTPLWSIKNIFYNGRVMYSCTVRLPINSPVKQDIVGHPMPTSVLARRIAALETCKVLHTSGELDDQLEPIGKEAFNAGLDEEDLSPTSWDPNLPRPGTTKSRQYYYKRIAQCLNNCRPVSGVDCILYNIDMVLTCPLPEEQNTRGRKLHPPELAPQGFGILTRKYIPKVCPFPIFTRSGEVCVSLRLCSCSIVLTERQVQTMAAFLKYIFTSVLRLQKYLMNFDPQAEENSFFIIPTKKNESGETCVDWEFLEIVYARKEETPQLIPEENRKDFTFDPFLYSDSVVMPWYRNQDQPQYFYVAEICNHLSPKSSFPGSDYRTFEDYYHKKYSIQIQNSEQPLLDVDHTSARLNFLTPRYVNRKGVALPTSSEETKRAKRENLEQKQILVPELCLVHVVPASLWRQAVCLPCILYRINALLLADEIRTTVAHEISLGIQHLKQDFEWPPLDFGWSLADVLKKSKEENDKKLEDIENELLDCEQPVEIKAEEFKDHITLEETQKDDSDSKDTSSDLKEEDVDSKDDEDSVTSSGDGSFVIGTWSNDMAVHTNDMAKLEEALDKELPEDIRMAVRYGSPTSWEVDGGRTLDYYYSDPDTDDSSDVDDVSSVQSDESSNCENSGLKITFKGDFLAEAIDENEVPIIKEDLERPEWTWKTDDLVSELEEEIKKEIHLFDKSAKKNLSYLNESGMLINSGQAFNVERGDPNKSKIENTDSKKLDFELEEYGMPWACLKESTERESSLDTNFFNFLEDENIDESDEFGLFSFDLQPDLLGHPGPSPSLILQALTMSNANDGINLERLETIGDSFLKYAITTYLYCTYENIHEGKLSHLRSKQVSNLNLYRLGRRKVFGESMIASKFEPHDNWLPPCYLVPRDAEQALLDAEPATVLPYNLVTQHSIPDKSIADCVEALIGAYLIACGPRGALIFMSWLGIKVLPREEKSALTIDVERPVGSTCPENSIQVIYGTLQPPKSPLLRNVPNPEKELNRLMAGFNSLESKLRYRFRDRAYLLQAMTHASYSPNRLTDCYQRLEFLGDAVLDYLITRHLYEDKRAHSPGALTDLRSALVNNTIFASLAVRHGLHKFFRHLSPGLGEVVQRFVTIQEENSHTISEEYYLVGEEAEDVEVPKALGDVFESVAGAIFLDSNMSLDTVWRVYYRMMKKEIEQFSTKVPKSPIRELLELEPETAKFGKPEKLADGRRVRVTVEVFGKGTFKGIGRNYRIAKCTAAKCALKQLKKKGLLARKLSYFNPPPQWGIDDRREQ